MHARALRTLVANLFMHPTCWPSCANHSAWNRWCGVLNFARCGGASPALSSAVRECVSCVLACDIYVPCTHEVNMLRCGCPGTLQWPALDSVESAESAWSQAVSQQQVVTCYTYRESQPYLTCASACGSAETFRRRGKAPASWPLHT